MKNVIGTVFLTALLVIAVIGCSQPGSLDQTTIEMEQTQVEVSEDDVNLSLFIQGPLGNLNPVFPDTSPLVRGMEAGVSFLAWRPNSLLDYTGVTMTYGFTRNNLDNEIELRKTGYGNYVNYVVIPQDAEGFYYWFTRNDGVVHNDNGSPYRAFVKDQVVSLSINYGKLNIKYAGPQTDNNTAIHFGWNDWNDVNDLTMSSRTSWKAKIGTYYHYNSIDLDIPSGAVYSDFVFHNGDNWDNNGGKDWHYSLAPLVNVIAGNPYGDTKRVSISYQNGTLDNPIAHIGIDGWNDIIDVELNAGFISIKVPADAEILNLCFFDENNIWENNFGNNWNIELK